MCSSGPRAPDFDFGPSSRCIVLDRYGTASAVVRGVFGRRAHGACQNIVAVHAALRGAARRIDHLLTREAEDTDAQPCASSRRKRCETALHRACTRLHEAADLVRRRRALYS